MNTNLTNPVKILSLPDQLFRSIKQMILSGEIKGGDRIPEVHISQRFGVSRTPIREALRKLVDYGLIEIKPRRRAEVLKMSTEEVKELSEVRLRLENLSVRLFVERATEDDLKAVQNLADECAGLAKARDFGGFNEKDAQFHLEIAQRTRNAFLYDALVRMDGKVQLSRLVRPLNLKDVQNSVAEHAEILKALRARKAADAEACMEKHINNNV